MKFPEGMRPKRATRTSAGYDLCCPIDIDIKAHQPATIDTGVSIEDDDHVVGMLDWVMLVFPRSSYGMKYGMRFLNSTGVIDSDYRDTIKLMVVTDADVHIKKGDRIAQGVIVPFGVFYNEEKPEVIRQGGLGSTGE